MLSNPLLPLLPGLLWPGMTAPDRILSIGQLELNFTYAKLNCLKENCFDIQLSVNKNYTYKQLNCWNFYQNDLIQH